MTVAITQHIINRRMVALQVNSLDIQIPFAISLHKMRTYSLELETVQVANEKIVRPILAPQGGVNQKGTTGLVPNVEIYAKGYETDGKLFGLRKADTYLSTILYKGYDSYRENYSSPDRIFNGSINYESPSITEQGGLEEENFTGAIEYPTEQMKFGDEIMFINFPYVFEKKD